MTLKQRFPAVVVIVCALALALAALPQPHARAATPAPYLGLVNMGMPTAPQPFMSDQIAFTKHQRTSCLDNYLNGNGPPADSGTCAMTADHGADCASPPAKHAIGTGYADMVFVCHDHLMTATHPAGAGGIEFQANQLVDFSAGPAIVSINRSTLITAGSTSRDYTEFYFVPFNEQEAFSSDGNIGEVEQQAHDFIQVLMRTQGGNHFAVNERVGGVDHPVDGNAWESLEQATGLVDSAVTRTPIIMTISQTHFTLACNGFTFADATLPVPFPTTRAVFQVQHIDYDPEKDGDTADTWHWSNLSISSAVPFYQQMAMPDAVGDYGKGGTFNLGLGDTIHFAPAPANSFLRFQGFDYNYTGFAAPAFGISFDGGATWQPWARQGTNDSAHTSVWQPIPAGATSARLRGGSGWYARDFYVMAANGASPPPATPTATATTMPSPTAVPPTATATAVPPTATPTATATAVATPTPVAINAVPCTVTLNGVTRSGTCSGTFTPSH